MASLPGLHVCELRFLRWVERTVPFGMLVQGLVIVWYHLASHSPKVVTDRREAWANAAA